MKVTKQFIEENRSNKGGWNFSQLSILKAGWPPVKGWKDRAIGMEISEEDARRFVEFGRNRPSKKERKRLRTSAQATHREIKRAAFLKDQQEVTDSAFLSSYEWRRVRMQVLKRDGARCACCGATPDDGMRMHVDHIKPRRQFPRLALDPNNLQVLCEVCNHGKGNWDSTDWRKKPAANDATEEEQTAHIRSIVHG